MPETFMPPLINPPRSLKMRRFLEDKLEEYKARKEGKGKLWEHTHPDARFKLYPHYRDAYYKVEVLTVVLAAKAPVNTHELSLEITRKLGDADPDAFNNACGVIALYLQGDTQLELCQQGKSLPPLEA